MLGKRKLATGDDILQYRRMSLYRDIIVIITRLWMRLVLCRPKRISDERDLRLLSFNLMGYTVAV